VVKRKGFPSFGEIVIVNVINITPYSALCKLEEYPGKEGMIHISEVSGKWVRDIKKFVKLNKTYVTKVVNVDEQKGHINLSLKRVSKIDKTRKMQDYKKEQKAEKILEKIAKKQKITLDKAYEKIGFELQDEFGEMFKAFDIASKNPEILVQKGMPKSLVDVIHKVAKESIQRKKIKIKAELEVKFYTGDGVEKTKQFLNNLINKYGVNIKYISAPKYSIEIKSDNPKLAQKELTKQLTDTISGIKDGEANFRIMGEK
jgi:translation initiation factor 2 subunit 1